MLYLHFYIKKNLTPSPTRQLRQASAHPWPAMLNSIEEGWMDEWIDGWLVFKGVQ